MQRGEEQINWIKREYNTGIYIIRNKVNGKRYIGQSVNIRNRWLRHIRSSVRGREYNLPLYKSIRKYGIENFEFSILKVVEREELDKWEKHYIEEFESSIHERGYNIRTNSESRRNFGGKITPDKLKKIEESLEECEDTKKEIADREGISVQMINNINRGEAFYERGREYPIRKISEYEVKRLLIQKGKGTYKLKCKVCKSDFRDYHHGVKVCSLKCREVWETDNVHRGNKNEKGSEKGNTVRENIRENKDKERYYRMRECDECGGSFTVKNKWGKHCSRKCYSKTTRKTGYTKENGYELYNKLKEIPDFTKVGKELGVTGKGVEKTCKRVGIPSKSKYYRDKYKEEKGYTYEVYKDYLEFKERYAERYKYIVDNYHLRSKRYLVQTKKIVGPSLYDAIGIIHGLERYDPQNRVRIKN